MTPRPTITTSRPATGISWVRQERLDARRRARHRARDAERQPAHVGGVHAVDVLVRIDGEQHGVEVHLRRTGVLHEHGVDCGSALSACTASMASAVVASAGRWTCGLLHPSSSAFCIFMPT